MKKITDILWARVYSEGGEYLGRVFDLRSQGEPEHGSSTEERVVMELLYGTKGLWERLGFRQPVVQSVAWESVKRFTSKGVVVEDK